MLDDYLLVNKKILPSFFDSVLKAKRLIESGSVQNVSQAVKIAGISRSTYYKYKDFIFENSRDAETRKAVFSMVLSHEPGVLSAVLKEISASGCSVLSITQSLPINHKAFVTVSLDVGSIQSTPEALLKKIGNTSGVETPRIVAID